jgi:predicted AlkP superfamily phosphohydrolase/phosphomutase
MNHVEPNSSDAATDTTASDHAAEIAVDKQAENKERRKRADRASEDARHERAREVGASETFAASTLAGGGRRNRRLLLICLDGAAPELAIGAWRTQLRTLHMLTDRGVRARLRAGVPWSSASAWQSLLAGQEPGLLGVFGHHHRPSHGYAAPVPTTSRDIVEPRLWDILGRAGRRVGVVGAPLTTPAPHVNGHLIGEPGADGELATHPAALAQQVASWLADEPELRPSASDPIGRLVAAAYARSEQRFRLARRLLARDAYDCFVLFDDGIATVQRALWHTIDVTHARYQPGHAYADTISAFYSFVDEQIGELLELVDDHTIVVVASACGAQALDGELNLNEWLIEQGDLVVELRPGFPQPLDERTVDWANTRAWAGDDGAIYLNVAGREPQGIVLPDQVEAALASLRERLHALAPPPGQPNDTPVVETYRPPARFDAVAGVAPDLLATCTRPGWRPSPVVGRGQIWTTTHTADLDAACESPLGFVVVYDPLAAEGATDGGRELGEATTYDLVPTLLALAGEPAAPRLRGRVMIEFAG